MTNLVIMINDLTKYIKTPFTLVVMQIATLFLPSCLKWKQLFVLICRHAKFRTLNWTEIRNCYGDSENKIAGVVMATNPIMLYTI